MSSIDEKTVNGSTQPCESFRTHRLTEKQSERLEHLQGLLGSEIQLTDLFRNDICIAGGAALYVLDEEQSLKNLGDIDFWVPETKREYVRTLCIEYTGSSWYRETDTMTYLFLDKVQTQFIFRVPGKTIQDLLKAFDYEVNQCAIVNSSYSITSAAFQEVCKTRQVRWRNACQDNYQSSYSDHSRKVRMENRKEKIRRKGFLLHGMLDYQHQKSHREEPHRPCWEHAEELYGSKRTAYTELLEAHDYNWVPDNGSLMMDE